MQGRPLAGSAGARDRVPSTYRPCTVHVPSSYLFSGNISGINLCTCSRRGIGAAHDRLMGAAVQRRVGTSETLVRRSLHKHASTSSPRLQAERGAEGLGLLAASTGASPEKIVQCSPQGVTSSRRRVLSISGRWLDDVTGEMRHDVAGDMTKALSVMSHMISLCPYSMPSLQRQVSRTAC